MTFAEFVSIQFPEKSVFDRVINNRKMDFFTNLVKWFALRFAYVVFRIGFSVNALDVIAFILSVAGYIFLAMALMGWRWLPLVGILLIYFHVFVDFADGPIAKARGTCSSLGAILDDLGCDSDRLAILILLGVFSDSGSILLANTFVGGMFIFFIAPTIKKMVNSGKADIMCRVYRHKYSFISVRFMLGILPLFFGMAILFQYNLRLIALFFSYFYIAVATVWLLHSIFNYSVLSPGLGSSLVMTFNEFIKIQFPERSVFDRVVNNRKIDFFTNLVKWFALRFGYAFYRLGISANALDAVTFLISLMGYILLSTAIQGERWLPLFGIALIYFHVFVDFADGPIAKAMGTCSDFGTILDELGGYVDRLALLVLIGLFSGHAAMILVNAFTACVFSLLVLPSRFVLPKQGMSGLFCKAYVNKYSLYSIRFMLGILPLILAFSIYFGWDLKKISTALSLIYICSAFMWLVICIPNYSKRLLILSCYSRESGNPVQ